MTKTFNATDSTEVWAKQAGLDYRIKRSKVRYVSDAPVLHEWPNQHVLFRSDTRAPLSVVSDGYKVVQPIQALQFFRELVDGEQFELVNAGSFGGGARYWAQARAKGGADVVKGDRVEPYLFFSSSCDGTSATVADFANIRIFCENTLRMALKGALQTGVRISHRTKVDEEVLADIRSRLGLVDSAFAQWLQDARRLAKLKVTRLDAEDFVTKLLAPQAAAEFDHEAIKKVEESRGFKKVMNLFADRKAIAGDLEGVDGTAWGLLNAVTQYVDHEKGERVAGSRAESAWFGDGANLKARAFDKLVELAS